MERAEEFERYLECGVLANGFARVRCGDCGHDLLVAFSCKRRGVCPSCNTRRMHDTAAHLVDAVIPRVPVRQWVLSVPRWARWILARDAQLASRALAVTLRAIFADYRRRARAMVDEAGRCGAVTFVQRFGGALNLNVHFHCVVPDGVFVRDGAALRFATMRPPTDEEAQAVLIRIARRLNRLLRPHRPGPDTELSSLDLGYAESLQASLPAGLAEPPRRKRQSALVEGFSLHAGVHLHANDREGLEKLCGYDARPPFALERLSALPDGRICYRLKRPIADGRTELLLAPTEFLRKLASLIPPPRHHLVRFHGVFALNAAWRKEVVPSLEQAEPPASGASAATAPSMAVPPVVAKAPTRIPWAELLERVLRIDVLRCERCGGRMTVLAFLTQRASVRKVLEHLGLPTTGPPIAKARHLPQFDFHS